MPIIDELRNDSIAVDEILETKSDKATNVDFDGGKDKGKGKVDELVGKKIP